MIRSNIIRFLNQTSLCYGDITKLFWVIDSNNGKFIFATQNSRYVDTINLYSSAYCKKFRKMSQHTFFKKNLITQWARVAFRGKSYRVKCFKRIHKFTFNFGYSHWTKFKSSNKFCFFRRRRQSYVIFTYSWRDMCFFKRQLPLVRVYNPYTMRGLRLKKQSIIRRFGKISQHVSILH